MTPRSQEIGFNACISYFNSQHDAQKPSPTNLVLYKHLMSFNYEQVKLEFLEAMRELSSKPEGIALHESMKDVFCEPLDSSEVLTVKSTASTARLAAAAAAIYHFLNQKKMESGQVLKTDPKYIANAEQGLMISQKIYGADPMNHRAAGILLMVFGAVVIAASGLALAVTCGASELVFLSSFYLATMIAGGVAAIGIGARAFLNRKKDLEVSTLGRGESMISSFLGASPGMISPYCALLATLGMTPSGVASFLTSSVATGSTATVSFGAVYLAALSIFGGFGAGAGLMVKGYQLVRGSYSAEAKLSQQTAALFKPAPKNGGGGFVASTPCFGYHYTR